MVVAAGSRWKSYRYTVTGFVCASRGGLPHDLRIGFHTLPDEQGVESVRDATATLSCTIDQPYARVLEEELYAVGSVGHAFLTSRDARRSAESFPHLVGVRFTYVHTVNPFISRWRSTVHAGIEASARFETEDGAEQRGGNTIARGAASGLDPERTWGGRNVGWTWWPSETLGEFHASGASGMGWGWQPDRDR